MVASTGVGVVVTRGVVVTAHAPRSVPVPRGVGYRLRAPYSSLRSKQARSLGEKDRGLLKGGGLRRVLMFAMVFSAGVGVVVTATHAPRSVPGK